MGPIRVLEDKRRRLAEFLIPQFRHASVRERLSARGPAWFQDRGEQAEELDARRPGGRDIECANVRKSLPALFRRTSMNSVNVTFKRPDRVTRAARSHGVGTRRSSDGRLPANAVSVGRRDDRTVCGRVLGLRKVDRPERVAIQREEDHAGAYVHGRRGVLSGEPVCPVGLPVQECRRARSDPRAVYRCHVWMVARVAVDHRRELFYRLAAGLRLEEAFWPPGGAGVRGEYPPIYGGPGAGQT